MYDIMCLDETKQFYEATMMDRIEETKTKIINAARELFLQEGIVNTDMKDIADRAGISRSTIYRYFSGTTDIIMVLAKDAVIKITNSIVIPDGYRFATGFDAFAWQLNSMIEALVHNRDDVTFIRDFDCVYRKSYPETEHTDDFIQQVTRASANGPMQKSYDTGIKDGSIRRSANPELYVLSIIQGALSIAERTLPREEKFIEEHGYGQEMLRCYAEIVLSAIKP